MINHAAPKFIDRLIPVLIVLGLFWGGFMAFDRIGLAGTFRTQNLVVDQNTALNGQVSVDTNGQAITISTFFGADSDGQNFWIGGGGLNAHGTPGNTNLGSQNVALGDVAGRDVTTGFDSVYVGGAAGRGVTSGGDNVGVGRSALQGDGVNPVTGHHNTALGVNTMGAAATSAEDCVAVGLDALEFITTGFQDSCTGYESCAKITSGFSNTVNGAHAFENADVAHDDVAIGLNALRDCTSCDHVTAIGRGTAGGITTGESDTILGGQITGLPAALTSWIMMSDGDGNIRQTNDPHAIASFGTADGTTFNTTAHLLQLSPRAPTSVSAGTLSATASDAVGDVTSIGSNTSVVLTFTGPAGSGFTTTAYCTATTHSGNQHINVSPSSTAPTFACVDNATGASANCVDFTYHCWGEQ